MNATDKSKSQKLEELSILAQQFNQECNKLNDTLAGWNERLAALHIGAVIWLVDHPLETSGDRRTCLGYCKVGDTWQLAVKEMQSNIDDGIIRLVDSGKPVRLLSASRSLRIKAAFELDHVLDALKDHLTRELATVNQIPDSVSVHS